MKEVFFALGVLICLKTLGLSSWFDIPLIIIIFVFDFYLKKAEIKAQGELEAFKLFHSQKGNNGIK